MSRGPRRTGAQRADLLAQSHCELAARDQVEFLDLVVRVSCPLLEIAVRRYADQGGGDLCRPQRLGEPAELAWDVGAGVGVANVIRRDDREVRWLARHI